MAIISLGTRPLAIGSGAVGYRRIRFVDTSAYLIKGQYTILQPNNIFSVTRIRGLIRQPGVTAFWSPTFIEIPPDPRPFSFYYPFSPIFSGNGRVQLFAEQISTVVGGFETGQEYTLELFYDDENVTDTWLQA